MSDLTTELGNRIKKGIGVLQTLRDEINVRVHLAGMDARDEWDRLMSQLEQVEREAEEKSTETTRKAVDELIERLEKFRETLH